ncbi:MAG: hypothetical protein AAGF12_00950 [Myxococcota bacterium]
MTKLGGYLALTLMLCHCAANGMPMEVVDPVAPDAWVDGNVPDREVTNDPPPPPPPECNDQICSEEETCETCPTDCGECPVCDLAPTCSGAGAVPDSAQAFSRCNGNERSSFSCGANISVGEHDCLDAQLRLRIRRLRIDRTGLPSRRDVYCVVLAEDGERSELLVTDPREAAGRDVDINFTLTEGVFWGQDDLVRSNSNLSINFRCYRQRDRESQRSLVSAIGDGVSAVGGALTGTGYGWVFTAGGAAADVASSAIRNVGDDPWLDVQQTISRNALYELTNGRRWTVDQFHDPVGSSRRVTLDIEAWGCANPRMMLR